MWLRGRLDETTTSEFVEPLDYFLTACFTSLLAFISAWNLSVTSVSRCVSSPRRLATMR